MIYRIDLQHFLVHAIDHLEFVDINYAIFVVISAKINVGLKDTRCQKPSILYPNPETVLRFDESQNMDVLEREMFDYYDNLVIRGKDTTFYDYFVHTMEEHNNVIIVCDKIENPYVDVLAKYLKKRFAIEVIDLNKMFTDGYIDPVRYDYNKIQKKGQGIRELKEADRMKSLACTPDGRMELLREWNKSTKLKLCKALKLRVRKSIDDKILDDILIDAWVNEDDA